MPDGRGSVAVEADRAADGGGIVVVVRVHAGADVVHGGGHAWAVQLGGEPIGHGTGEGDFGREAIADLQQCLDEALRADQRVPFVVAVSASRR